MYELKSKFTDASVEAFLDAIANEKKRADSYVILDMMKKITKQQPKMWGPSIISFGSYHYKYESGHEGDCPIAGFSPRKASLTIYIMPDLLRYSELMGKLGKYKTGKTCLYINKLEDVDQKVLKDLIKESYDLVCKKK